MSKYLDTLVLGSIRIVMFNDSTDGGDSVPMERAREQEEDLMFNLNRQSEKSFMAHHTPTKSISISRLNVSLKLLANWKEALSFPLYICLKCTAFQLGNDQRAEGNWPTGEARNEVSFLLRMYHEGEEEEVTCL